MAPAQDSRRQITSAAPRFAAYQQATDRELPIMGYSAWVVGSLCRTRSSWLRELMASLAKTLPRW